MAELGANEITIDYAVDETRLFRFLQDTQPDEVEKISILNSDQRSTVFKPARARLQAGSLMFWKTSILSAIYHVLYDAHRKNKGKEMFDKNIFSVTRTDVFQNNAQLALDFAILLTVSHYWLN